MRVAIYTAIYDGYDNLKSQPPQTVDRDFICFTDDAKMTPAPPWRIVHSCPKPIAHLHPRRYPEHNGLFAGGLIVRDLQAGRLKSINSQWWKENLRWCKSHMRFEVAISSCWLTRVSFVRYRAFVAANAGW